MKILVCVKQSVMVPKYVEFSPDGGDVDPAFMTRDLSEADAYAIEAALLLKEARGIGEVVVVTAGEIASDEVLRQCLARGADTALRVAVTGSEIHDPVLVARKLAVAVRQEAPDLVMCGVQSGDAAQQSTGPALASSLGWPVVSVVTRIEVSDGLVLAEREFEGGLREQVEVALPAVVTVQIGANTPRYGSFKGMMKAKKMDIPVLDAPLPRPRKVVLRRMTLAEAAGKRKVTMIPGGPADVASRILQLVEETRA